MYSAIKINVEFLRNCVGIIGILFGFLSYNTIPYTKKCFENTIKQDIMPLVCSCFDNLEWTNNGYYDDSIFFNANLLVNYPKFTAK